MLLSVQQHRPARRAAVLRPWPQTAPPMLPRQKGRACCRETQGSRNCSRQLELAREACPGTCLLRLFMSASPLAPSHDHVDMETSAAPTHCLLPPVPTPPSSGVSAPCSRSRTPPHSPLCCTLVSSGCQVRLCWALGRVRRRSPVSAAMIAMATPQNTAAKHREIFLWCVSVCFSCFRVSTHLMSLMSKSHSRVPWPTPCLTSPQSL